MKDVLYVLGLKKNILFISALDAKGIRVAFVDGKILMWPKGNIIDDATVFGDQEGDLYKLKGQPEQELVHYSIEPSELWHRRLVHKHYRTLSIASKVILGLPKIQTQVPRIRR